MDLLQAVRISATGLNAHRKKMNIIAQNLANTETTRTAEGEPYRRQMVVLEEKTRDSFQDVRERLDENHKGVAVGDVVQSQEAFRMVYNPSHPDADPATGYVAMPNVNLLTEIADMVVARRSYDANATAIANTKSMIQKALEIGK